MNFWVDKFLGSLPFSMNFKKPPIRCKCKKSPRIISSQKKAPHHPRVQKKPQNYFLAKKSTFSRKKPILTNQYKMSSQAKFQSLLKKMAEYELTPQQYLDLQALVSRNRAVREEDNVILKTLQDWIGQCENSAENKNKNKIKKLEEDIEQFRRQLSSRMNNTLRDLLRNKLFLLEQELVDLGGVVVDSVSVDPEPSLPRLSYAKKRQLVIEDEAEEESL